MSYRSYVNMNDVSLSYPGKIGREELYKIVKPVGLRVMREFMKAKPLLDDGWRNMLILGDNLPILRTLLEDPKVRQKVRLAYIDPPSGTGDIFRDRKHVNSSLRDEIAYHDMPLSPLEGVIDAAKIR